LQNFALPLTGQRPTKDRFSILAFGEQTLMTNHQKSKEGLQTQKKREKKTKKLRASRVIHIYSTI
jgi:hypothetical protein